MCLSSEAILSDLTPSYRRVLQEYIRLSKKYTHVYTLTEKVAERARCCKRTVQRAIKHFMKKGWLGKVDRRNQSSQYFLADEIKKKFIEKSTSDKPPKKQDFSSENVTPMSPIDTSYKEKKEIDSKNALNPCIMHKNLNSTCLSNQDRLKLENEFGGYYLQQARERCDWSIREKKFKPNSLFGYIKHLCRKIKGEINGKN